MSKSAIGKLLIVVVLTAFIYLQYIVIDRVIKRPDSLSEASGIITNIQKIKIPKRYAGYHYAYALTIKENPLRFAVHKKNQRAYDYIRSNIVKGNRIRLLYDKNGFNSNDDLTYHIYFIEINGRQILDINESKQTDKIGLAIFFAFDLFILIMILYIRKQKQ